MKFSTVVPVALLAASVGAQNAYTTSTITGPGEGTTTEYYSLCPSDTGLITVTGTITETYCPGPNCNGQPTAGPRSGYTTVYTTVWSQFCSTGLAPATYTITEACPCHGMGQPDYIPQGCTTTVATCETCGEGTITATLTYPIGGSTAAPAYGGGSAGPGQTSPPLVGNLPGNPAPGAPAVPASRAGGYPAAPTSPAGGVSNGSAPVVPNHAASGASSTGPSPAVFTGAAPAISIESLFFTLFALTTGVMAWLL
jgi:hypothetical protein